MVNKWIDKNAGFYDSRMQTLRNRCVLSNAKQIFYCIDGDDPDLILATI
jgi:hypothetical protein